MWKMNAQGMILLPEALVCPILQHPLEGAHYGRDAVTGLIRPHLRDHSCLRLFSRSLKDTNCVLRTIQKLNAILLKGGYNLKGLLQRLASWFYTNALNSGVFWVPSSFCRYFLRVGRRKPNWTEKAADITRCLLKEITPRFGLPSSIQKWQQAIVYVRGHPKGKQGITNKLETAHCLEGSINRKNWEDEPHLEENNCQNMSRNPP